MVKKTDKIMVEREVTITYCDICGKEISPGVAKYYYGYTDDLDLHDECVEKVIRKACKKLEVEKNK